MNKTKNNKADIIREMRTKKGLTQREFGELFGIPINNIQKWEQGINKPTSYTLLMMTRIIEMTEEIELLKEEIELLNDEVKELNKKLKQ